MNRDETEIHILSSVWEKKVFHKEFKRVGPSQIVSFGKRKKLQISCSEGPEGKAAARVGPAYFGSQYLLL